MAAPSPGFGSVGTGMMADFPARAVVESRAGQITGATGRTEDKTRTCAAQRFPRGAVDTVAATTASRRPHRNPA